MVIDIKRTVLRIQLRRFITMIVFVILILAAMFLVSEKREILGLSKYQWALIIAVLYVAVMIIEALWGFNYIYFSDEEGMIMLRFFSLGFFNRRKQAIQIPKDAFGGYTIRQTLGGIKKKIILYHKFKQKNAKYPPVNISALSRNDLHQLKITLDRYIVNK
ncbi:MAG: hypothetical protein JW894_00245 [Bacteroidales bacterium]|nr:hypothetical protein [Bacteroidales bacterium]